MLCIQSVWMFLWYVGAMTWEGTRKGFCEVMVAKTALISMGILMARMGLRANNCCVVRKILTHEEASHRKPV